MGKLKSVPLSSIRKNEVALRNVNTECEEYLGLVDSIRRKGFIGAISVREKKDTETGALYYELIDGLHRFMATCDAGWESINVDIQTMEDVDVLESQIMMNIHKIDTPPAAYSKQLRRLLNLNPTMTAGDLAQRLGKSIQWVENRLSLNKIENPRIIQAINDGEIKLANAYALSKLPEDEQVALMERAMSEQPDEFVPAAQNRVKELAAATRKGREAAPAQFVPTAHLQKLKDIKDELENGIVGKAITDGDEVKMAGFKLAIQWVLNLDVSSVEIQRAKFDEQQAKAKALADAKAKERAAAKKRKAEAAAKEAEDAMNSLEG